MGRYIVTPRQVTEVTAPAAEPVTLTQAKLHLRVDHSTDDTLITALIEAARQYVENATQRSLVQRTYRADIHDWASEIVLPFPPLQAVQTIKYYDTSSPSVLSTLYDSTSSPQDLSAEVRIDLRGNRIVQISGVSFPSHAIRHDAIQITYLSGLAPTGSPLDYTAPIPEALRSAILLVVGDLYENREGQVIGQGFTPTANRTVDLILDQWRVLQ